ASVRVHRRVDVGVGVLALAALVGNISIADHAGRITTVAEEQLTTSLSPIVGVRVRTLRWLKLGAVFRGESKSTYDIAITNTLGSRLPLTLPTMRIAGVAQYDPMQIAVEGAFAPLHWLTIDAGVTWKHWAGYGLPTENATLGTPPQPPPDFADTAVPRGAPQPRQPC